MAKAVIKNVQTQSVDFAPILGNYFKKCGIQRIIDEQVALDPRRKVLSHGKAAVAMITAILFQVMQLYRICRFASEKKVLKVLLPEIEAEQYFDDRLADTLDALFAFGFGDWEMLITQQMIRAFEIESEVCHSDTTSVSVYGDADNNQTEQSIRLISRYSVVRSTPASQAAFDMFPFARFTSQVGYRRSNWAMTFSRAAW